MYTLPAERTYPWSSYCGIPGGIPTRTTIYRTLTSSATSAEILSAISACPAGQVLQLAEGDYNLTTLAFSSPPAITIRGAGAGRTNLNFATGSGFYISHGSRIGTDAGAWTTYRSVSSGYTKGSTTLVLSSAPTSAWAVGNLIQITQDDDYDLVWHRDGNWAGAKNLRFTSRIIGVSGTQIELATPIPHSYSAGMNPICAAQAPTGGSLFGIEDMTITVNGGTPVAIESYDRCWLYRVELVGGGNTFVEAWAGSQFEVRRCYIHDASGFPSADGYWVQMQYGNSCYRIEDNIAYRTATTVVNSGAAGFVGYNYAYDTRRTTHEWVEFSYGSNHGPHGIMTLWEGNIGQRYQNDGYHGSTSHQTLFRNNLHGVSPAGYTQERQLVDLVRGSYYESVIGNVLGAPSWTPTAYQATTSADHPLSYVYVLGWGGPDSASPTTATVWTNWVDPLPDGNVEATIIRQANYDYYNNAVQYEDADHDIANSLFYDSKPTYFGNLAWPPIDPFTATVNQTPSKWRWDQYVAGGSTDVTLLFQESPTAGGYILTMGNSTHAVQAPGLNLAVGAESSFTLSAVPTSRTIAQRTTTTYVISATPVGGFSGTIRLTVSGNPAGSTALFGGASSTTISASGSATLTVVTDNMTAPVGTYTITVTGNEV